MGLKLSRMPPLHERRSYGSGLALMATIAKDLQFLAHWHDDIEMLLVESGSIVVGVNRETKRLGKGDFVALGSRDIHYYERTEEGSRTILVVLKSELVSRTGQWPSRGALAAHFATKERSPSLAEATRPLMTGILEEMKTRKAAYEGLVRGRAAELCALAERELGLSLGSEGGGESRGSLPSLRRMQLAIDYLYENYAYPIGLEDAARAAALSPTYFSRVFSRTVGTSFRAFLNGIRVERACELMAKEEARLSDIALDCGFESVRSFNRAFRELRGQAPSALRAKARDHFPEGRGL
jgi:AraC-like DNA-binding protein